MSSDIKANIGHARNLARKVLKEAQIKNAPVLISQIVAYLKNQYDLSIYSWDFEETISGVQIANSPTSCNIAYNANQHVHRQRLTVAHEIGHFLLGHTREVKVEHFKPTEVQESEAFEFAGELLMPLSKLKEQIKLGGATIDSLASDFFVSREAMSIRLMKTRLLTKL